MLSLQYRHALNQRKQGKRNRVIVQNYQLPFRVDIP
jgi:hypothetical protein